MTFTYEELETELVKTKAKLTSTEAKLADTEARLIQRKFREGAISLRSRNARFRHQKLRLENRLVDGLANGSDELSGLCERLLDYIHKLWTFSEFTNPEIRPCWGF